MTLMFRGELDDSEAAIQQALATFRGIPERRGEAWALQNLAWIAFTRGRPEEAEERINQSAAVFAEIGDWGGLSWALGLLAWVRFNQGHLAEAQECLEDAMARVAAAAGAYDDQSRILNRLGGVVWARGDMVQARHYVERSLEAARRSGDLLGQANALNNLGLITERQGRVGEAIRYGQRAMELYERMGNRRMLAVSANNVGYAFYNNDQHAQAQELLTQALERAAEVHDTYHEMLARLNLGRALTALHDWDSAEAVLGESLALAEQLDLAADRLEVQVALGTLALQRGDLPAARQAYNAAAPLATEVESEEYGRFERLAARLTLAEGDLTVARRLLAANETLFIRLQNMPEAGRTRKLLLALTNVLAPSTPALEIPPGANAPPLWA